MILILIEYGMGFDKAQTPQKSPTWRLLDEQDVAQGNVLDGRLIAALVPVAGDGVLLGFFGGNDLGGAVGVGQNIGHLGVGAMTDGSDVPFRWSISCCRI